MKNVDELSHEELTRIVAEIQGIAFLDMDRERNFWNPDKSLGADFIGDVCNLLARHGLRPETERELHE